MAIAVAGAVRDASGDLPAGQRRPQGARSRPAWWLVGCVVGAACVCYLGNLHATYERDPGYSRQLGARATVVSANIAAGIKALPPSRQQSIVDVSMPFPIWYDPILGYLPKNGEFDRLMPNWSSTAHTYGEGQRLVGLDADGQLHRVSFDVQSASPTTGGASESLGASAGASLYERIVVTAPSPTVMRIVVVGVRPVEPVAPWLIPLGPGRHSFVLAGVVEHAAQRAGLGTRHQARRVGRRERSCSANSRAAARPANDLLQPCRSTGRHSTRAAALPARHRNPRASSHIILIPVSMCSSVSYRKLTSEAIRARGAPANERSR